MRRFKMFMALGLLLPLAGEDCDNEQPKPLPQQPKPWRAYYTLRVEEHQRLLDGLGATGVREHGPCLMLNCSCRQTLRRTLSEAIGVLESTRRSFKSKELEMLRKKLVEVLAANT